MNSRPKGSTSVLSAPVAEESPQHAYEQAFKLLTLGYSVIPVQLAPDEENPGKFKKTPLVAWKQYQDHGATVDELADWYERLRPSHYGIVTGAVSGCDVIDADSEEARKTIESEMGPPHVVTPRGGGHWYVETNEHSGTKAGIAPSIDCRSEGGFAVIVGPGYSIQRLPHPDNLIPYNALPERLRNGMNGHKASEPLPEVVREGERNSRLASIAGRMRRDGAIQGEIQAALQAYNLSRCRPPLPASEVAAIASSISRYESITLANKEHMCTRNSDNGVLATESDKYRTDSRTEVGISGSTLAQRVRNWVEDAGTGWWPVRELDSDLGIQATADKDYRGKILRRLREEGLVQQHTKIAKQFRKVDSAVTSLDFKHATSAGVLDLEWPLDIHDFVNFYPGNVAVVAGAPNAGKTAFLLDFTRRNMEKFPIHYWCSEMGDEELRDRLEKFPGTTVEDWQFEAHPRAADFEDVLIPDVINIVDFLEMTTDLWEVNTHLTEMQHRIGSGLAIVAIQKKLDGSLGRGAEFGLEKPKLYLSMDQAKTTIVKGKSWARKGVDPNGLVRDVRVLEGWEFVVSSDWRRP